MKTGEGEITRLSYILLFLAVTSFYLGWCYRSRNCDQNMLEFLYVFDIVMFALACIKLAVITRGLIVD